VPKKHKNPQKPAKTRTHDHRPAHSQLPPDPPKTITSIFRINYLCWSLEEDEIRFWHPVDSGYAGRRPL
jgi:hypothetical protein